MLISEPIMIQTGHYNLNIKRKNRYIYKFFDLIYHPLDHQNSFLEKLFFFFFCCSQLLDVFPDGGTFNLKNVYNCYVYNFWLFFGLRTHGILKKNIVNSVNS